MQTIDPTDNYGLHQKFRLMYKGKGHVARQLLRENFTNRRCDRVPISSCQKFSTYFRGYVEVGRLERVEWVVR